MAKSSKSVSQKRSALSRLNDPMHSFAELPILCDAPTRRKLTPDQMAALHVFKHEVLAAGFRVYEKIPPKLAGPIIASQLGNLMDTLNRGTKGSSK